MSGRPERFYALEGPVSLASLDDLQDLIERVRTDHAELDPGDLLMFETALIEICGNVVKHGRPRGEVHYAFRLEVLQDRLLGSLSDDGHPVPPLQTEGAPDPRAENGRGLMLAAATLDELTCDRAEGRNVWRLVRRRRDSQAPCL